MTKNNIQNFREASRAYSDASIFMHEAIARKAGLSSTDHKYLGLILQYESITAGEISKLTGLTTGAVTGLIDRLEKKNLLKREFTKEDRRKVIIIPNTENSMKLLGPIFEELQQKTMKLVSTFSKKEIETIERYFREATVLMKETTDHLNNP
ncbi:MarR family transcriptional regulator [Chryseobacterium cucumeris]|uniref:MarR family winged helix-turn-helix transcriptional regulator n=1 Tax=Chryseobacterium TaxID=59732 RepID=UPI000789911D|nr:MULTISPECIES: MarR family transcriptional regulator [Chryseobacterium]KYH07745.1 transcriptional regulator [Chryseobacterium cucumeris]QWT87380.1 MarR family transcriptional regulator [Chryseobacterium sp. PCH239]RKE80917.1 DNA-binding MarR family transcriptional regulator [Chryseobacterium sp. AG363]TXI99861.1 MAG: MarR family transcriptional regulator [Chryseobacterium cucumeris]